MEVYLLRHGQSVANEKGLVCGRLDFPLSPLGLQQAAAVSAHLSSIKFTHIYSSPLSRAVETISRMRMPVVASRHVELMELDTGDFSHMTLGELWGMDQRYIKPWLTPELGYPNGERFSAMIDRIKSWYDVISKSWSDNSIVLIVGHEGTVRSIYSYLLDLDICDYPDFPIGNCNYLYFQVSGGQVVSNELINPLQRGEGTP